MPAEALATAACPKHMTYGPCGGVRADAGCEIDAALPCPFVPLETVTWRGAPVQSPDPGLGAWRGGDTALGRWLRTGPIVVADFPARALDASSIEACAAVLRGRVDAVLAGDSGPARVQFSPTYRARLIQDAGLVAWMGLNCRDRNRVAIEAELAGLAHVGVAAVHCVTGDHTATGARSDARPVFDLDGTRLAALARAAGHVVSVGETPTAPPVERRAARLLEKQRAGAQVCFVNHSGGVEPVAAFIARTRAVGVTLDFIPCVPIVLDADGADLVRGFSATALPAGYAEGILRAADSRAAGIAAAVELASGMLTVDGVVGVDLSGGPTQPDGAVEFARALAEIGARVREAPAGRAA